MVQSLGIWSKSERWKSDKRCLMSWMKIKKIIVLKCHFLLFNTITMNHVLIGLWRVMKVDFIWEPVMTSSVIGPRNSKALTKAKLAPKKGHGHWWSAAGLIHYSFLNLGNTITSEKYAQQIDEMQQKLQWAGIGQQHRLNSSPQQHPNTCVQSMLQKLNKLGYEVFASSATFTWLLTNWLQLLQESQQPAGGRKCFQELVESQSMDFYATGINKIISH